MEWIKVKKKPIEVEAFQLTEEMYINDLFESFNGKFIKASSNNKDKFIVETLEGDMTAKVGDWIIKGVKDEIYPCKKDIFEETYDKLQLTKSELEIGFALSKIPKNESK